jgi:hypothetical protein
MVPLGEERQVDLKRRCGWLALSAQGLVVTCPDEQEILLLDPETLKVKKSFVVAGVKRTVSSPALSVAFAADARWQLVIVDLASGEVSQRQKGHGFGLPEVTPDGKYLFSVGGVLHRYRITRNQLIHEKPWSEGTGSNPQQICISPDSKYVCVTSGGGNGKFPGYPYLGNYSTYILPVTKLREPAFGIQQGAYPKTLAFDPKAQLVYAQNYAKDLLVYRYTGAKVKAYSLVPSSWGTQLILAHPEGYRALILTERKLFFVELPRL